MTGNPFYKIRVITSEELELKLAGKKDFNEIALAFKQALVSSSSKPTLDAAYSIKALANVTGSETYKDTDNKKRTNTGAPTGLVEKPGGIRYIENQKWEPGRSLYLTPSQNSRRSNSKEPNFGWLEDPKPSTPEQYARDIANQPKIRFRKYKVNPKTNEVIESSEQPVDQFSLNGNAAKQLESPETKRLPGATIGSRGRSLLARAAGAFGVIVDEANKFRCPPGTPAANQFTDHMGTNCFGISSSEILNFALDKAKEIGDESKFRNSVRNFFNFVSYLDNGGVPGIGRTVWRDENGKRIRNIRKWREASLNDRNSRLFVDGMVRAQDRLKQQDKIISDLMDDLDVIRTPERMETNEDVYDALAKLRASGAWTVNVLHGDGERPTKEQVNRVMRARLSQVPGFSNLSAERQEALIKADTERYYQTERAILEAALDSFVADPEHMRSVNQIKFRWEINPDDEANANLALTEDTKRLSSIITFHIPQIMANQEAMLPQLAPNERLRIDVVGAKTDAEAATVLSDFLVTVDGYSKQLAAMVEERAFARHIAKHEIAHTIQMGRFVSEAKRQIETNGFIEVRAKDGTLVKIDKVENLTSGMIGSLMTADGDSIDLESLNNALSRTDVVAFLAGDYPKKFFNDEDGAQLWAIEALAELHALRDLGIIYGDDIDAALEWMDEHSDQRYITERRLSTDEGLRIIKESYYANVGPDREILGETKAVIRKREAEETKNRLNDVEKFANDPSTTESQLAKELADVEEWKEDLSSLWSRMDAAGLPSDHPERISNRKDVAELDKKAKILERAWNERFGKPGEENRSANKKKMRELIDAKRESKGTLDPEKLKVRIEEREKKEASELASSLDEDGLVRKLADLEILLKDPDTSKDEREKIKKQQKIFKDAFKQLRIDSGDERAWATQRRELEKKIFDIVVPETERVIAKPKKFKNSRSSGTWARQTRRDLEDRLTAKQAEAVKQLERTERTITPEGDDGPPITRIMKQSEQVSAVKEINRNHRKAQRGTAEINGETVDNASVEQQIENVLIPALEAFEQAEVADNFEVDASVYVPVGDDDAPIVQDTIFVSEIVKGRVITQDAAAGTGTLKYVDGEDVRNRWGTEKKQRVVIQVAKGDRAILSRGDSGAEDKASGFATLPPGTRLRVVDRREDGTIVARIERQESITDTLSRISNIFNDADEGPGPSQHAKGTKKKIDRTINKYIAQRRENGLSSVSSERKPSPAIESRNNQATRTVRETGGSFGEAVPDDYVEEYKSSSQNNNIDETLGADVLGIPQTREQRTKKRRKKIESTVDLLKGMLAGEDASELWADSTKGSVDPAVVRLIYSSTPEEIAKKIEDAAVEFHEGIDKRPRVRMTETQLDSFIESGEFLPDDPDEVILESGAIGRRLERRLNPKQRRTRAEIGLAPMGSRNFEGEGFSSGKRGGKLSGILGSRVTDRIVDATLSRTGADEKTKERVKYGMQFAGALAAGGPAGFAAALAQDVARRAGREIAERVLEEAVERGHITAEMAELAMRQVDRVAPNGLPDEAVDKLADAWQVGSQFMDERVFTEENAQKAREIVGRARETTERITENMPDSVAQATGRAKERIGGVASRVRGRISARRRGGDGFDELDSPSQNQVLSTPSTRPSAATEYDDPFEGFDATSSVSPTSEFDDPFADMETPAANTTPRTEYDDPFSSDAFASGKKSGRATTYYNKEYQARIGLSKGMPSSNRPVSGYVVHRSHDEERRRRVKVKGKGNLSQDAVFEIGDNDIAGDGLTAFGEIEIVLRPEVSQRTSYGRGDSLVSAHRPVLMNSVDAEDIADALVNTDGINNSTKDAEAMVHLLQASMDKNFSSINAGRDEKGRMVPVGKLDPSERPHEPLEAHILGGFKKDEVEGIHYPYSRIQKLAEDEDISDVVNEVSIKGRLEKLGFTPEEIAYFYSVSDSSSMNTPSMQKLREYRAAKKVKNKYENSGIEYVRIAHPDGLNIENPRTYDKNAMGNENVGLMLQQQVVSEMDAEFKKALEGMRKPGAREVVV